MFVTLEYNLTKNIFEEFKIPIEVVPELTFEEIGREDFFGQICIYVNLRSNSKKDLKEWKHKLLLEAFKITNKQNEDIVKTQDDIIKQLIENL
jgi:hypothetical protein